jgi:hypothetical protein
MSKAEAGEAVSEAQQERCAKFLSALEGIVSKARKAGKAVEGTGELEALRDEWNAVFPKEPKGGSRQNALAELGIVIE